MGKTPNHQQVSDKPSKARPMTSHSRLFNLYTSGMGERSSRSNLPQAGHYRPRGYSQHNALDFHIDSLRFLTSDGS